MTKGHGWSIFFTGLLLMGGNFVLLMGLSLYEYEGTGAMTLIITSLIDTIYDFLGCLVTIAMFLYYWNLRSVDSENAADQVKEQTQEGAVLGDNKDAESKAGGV